MVSASPSKLPHRGRLLAGATAILLLAAGLATAAPSQAAAPTSPPPATKLQISSVKAAAKPVPAGTSVTTTFVVKNLTGARKPATKARLFLVSTDDKDYGLGEANVPATKPGTKTPVTTKNTPNLNAPAGQYRVRVCLSPNPDGNCRDSKTKITIQPSSLRATPSSVDFGEAPVGSSSEPETVTITNNGHARTGPLDVEVTNDDVPARVRAGDAFSVANVECGPSLDPGASCDVEVEFAPDSVGPATGALTVSGRRGATVSVDLSGTGTGEAALAISPADVEFDDTLVDDTSDPVTFTVTSVGLLPTGIPVASLGAGSGDFEIVGTNCATPLAPGQTCTVTVAFTPSSPGDKASQLVASATPGGSATADLSGTGLAPASLTLTPPSAAFGAEVVGEETDPVTFTLANDGDVASGTPTVALGGIDADQFTIVTNGCTAPVAADGSCTIDVAFAPTATGSASASLDVSAGPGGSDTSTLTGTGETAPTLSISEASYDYGFSSPPAEHAFTVTNTGTRTSGVPVVDLAGAAAFEVTSSTCTAALAGGASCTVGVTYTSSGSGAEQSAQLSVSASPGDTVTADLTGSPAALTIAPASHDFGGVLVGSTSAVQEFVLTNHRLTPSFIDGEGTTGSFDRDSSCLGLVLPPGGTCTFSGHFAPNVPGPTSGAFDYFSMGEGGSTELSGEGLTPAALSLNPTTLDFGAYEPGSGTTQQVTITNTGTEESATVGLSITGPDAVGFYVASTDCPATLAGGASCTATIGFTAMALGYKDATLTVTGGTGGTAALVGMSAPAGVTLFEPVYDFGSLEVGGSRTHTFRVVNTTDSGAGINSVSSATPFTLDLGADFTCVLSVSVIDAHRWCTVSIAFRPSSATFFSRTISSAGDGFNTASTVTGTGTPARGTSLKHGDPDAVARTPQSVVLRHGRPVLRY